jgi:hypothetical protein
MLSARQRAFARDFVAPGERALQAFGLDWRGPARSFANCDLNCVLPRGLAAAFATPDPVATDKG